MSGVQAARTPDATGPPFPPPFFIVGPPRSGTTLVSEILRAHPRLAVYHESHYYHFLRASLPYYGDLRRQGNLFWLIDDVRELVRAQGQLRCPSRAEFLGALPEPSFEGVFSALLCLYARERGRSRAGDKTPGHVTYLPEILARFPDSPVICVVRDPRDCVISNREAFGASVEGAAWAWRRAVQNYQRASSSLHLVQYEQLVRQPEATVRAICTFLGEPYEPEMLRFFERNPRDPHHARPQHRRVLGPVDAASVGRFRAMSQREIEQVEAICRPGMAALGYEPATAGSPHAAVRPPTRLDFLLDRLRYYRGARRRRGQQGWLHWRIVLRAWVRYWLAGAWLRGRPAGARGEPP